MPLWVDIQMVQPDAAGGYLALLGAATELPVDLFATSQALWLGVQPEGQAEQPRVRFISVPYALKASDADTLGGRPLSEFVLLSGGEGSGSAKTADALATDSSDNLATTNDLNEPGNLTVDGSVGIGTAGPSSRLHIEGTDSDFRLVRTGGASFLFQPGAGPNATQLRNLTSHGLSFWTSNTERMRVAVNGNVGIGTLAPDSNLEIAGTEAAFRLVRTGGASFLFQAGAGGNPTELRGLTSNPMSFWTSNTEQVRIATNGDVGIGTTSPSAKLHVAGDVVVDGNLAAKYQDVAEWVEAVGAPTPGTVVVADSLRRNVVKLAEAPYDTAVLGAVSLQPGLVLGESGPNKVLVAQSGRVMVKVDASYGAIATGDLLSTSPTPGHAMRSDPLNLGELSLHRPGTVLGKALEPLETGRGEILVLITLQ